MSRYIVTKHRHTCENPYPTFQYFAPYYENKIVITYIMHQSHIVNTKVHFLQFSPRQLLQCLLHVLRDTVKIALSICSSLIYDSADKNKLSILPDFLSIVDINWIVKSAITRIDDSARIQTFLIRIRKS